MGYRKNIQHWDPKKTEYCTFKKWFESNIQDGNLQEYFSDLQVYINGILAGNNHMWFFSIGGQHIFALPSWNIIKQNLNSVLHWVGITKLITKCQYTE